MIERVDAAYRYYRQKFPVPVGSHAAITYEQRCNLDRWLADYVAPAISEAMKSATFRSRVLHTRDLLELGAQTDERRLVNETEKLFRKAADLLQSLYQQESALDTSHNVSDTTAIDDADRLARSGFMTESLEQLAPILSVARCPFADRRDFLSFNGDDQDRDDATAIEASEWLLSDSVVRGLMAKVGAASEFMKLCVKSLRAADLSQRRVGVLEELSESLEEAAVLRTELTASFDLSDRLHLEESCLKAFKGFVAFCAPVLGKSEAADTAWVESTCEWLGYETETIIRAFASLQSAARSRKIGADIYEVLAAALGVLRQLPQESLANEEFAGRSPLVLNTGTGAVYFDQSEIDLRTKNGRVRHADMQLLRLLIRSTKRSTAVTAFDLDRTRGDIPTDKALNDKIYRLRNALNAIGSLGSLIERTKNDPLGFRLKLQPGEITLR